MNNNKTQKTAVDISSMPSFVVSDSKIADISQNNEIRELHYKDKYGTDSETNLSLGLDIGTTSIGFALTNIESGEIIESNSVIFHRKETTDSENRTLARRLARVSRRTIARRNQRKKNLKKLLFNYGFVNKEFIDNTREYIQNNPVDNLFFLRSEATKRALSDYELARILYSFGSRRGYSDRYDLDEKDKGAIAVAVSKNQEMLGNYNTFGEMLWSINPEKCRNGKNDYSNLATMKDIKNEIRFILEKQKHLGNKKITDEFIDEILLEDTYKDGSVSLFYQRPLHEISGQVGLCSYQHYIGYKRASKATYTFLEYVFLEKLHNTPIIYNGESCSLFSKITNISDALQKFIANDGKFNITFIKSLFTKEELKNITIKLDSNNKAEDKTLGKNACVLLKTIHSFERELAIDEVDKIATILTVYQDMQQKKEQLAGLSLGLSSDEINELSCLDFSGFGRLAIETMQSMIPLIKDGKTPYEAKKECGFTLNTNSQKFDYLPPLNCDRRYIENVLSKKVPSLDIDTFVPFYNAIDNPVVNRVVSVLRKVTNQIIDDYGVPQRIVIEMARDYNSAKEKKEISKAQNLNRKNNELLEKSIKEAGYEPNHKNIKKYQYWKEQNGYCLYSDKKIPLIELFSDNVEVEHVLPCSKVFVDRNKNKIVVFKKENQNKGSLYHYEYLKKEHKWDDFCNRVKGLARDNKIPQNKAEWLLCEDFSGVSKDSFLNDTRYATRLIAQYLEYYLYPSDDIHRTGYQRTVFAINGKATAFFRKHWGLQGIDEIKDRDNLYHHAIDAIVIASISPRMINNISKFYKAKEQGLKVQFDMPYSNFRKDVFEIIKQYQENKKFVCHHRKIKKNVIAYEGSISTVLIDGKEFVKKRTDIFDFIERIKAQKKAPLEDIIDGEINKIVDNSTDKFIANNIKNKIMEILKLESEIDELVVYKKEIKNNQDEIEIVDKKIKNLQERIKAPFVVHRGKKKTPQIIKEFSVIGKGAGAYNKVSNKKDTTVQKKKNKESIGMELWRKNGKMFCVPLYLHNIWNRNNKTSKTGVKIDDTFEKVVNIYPKTVLKVKRKDSIDYILYRGVGSTSESFEYQEINKKSNKRLFLAVNTCDDIIEAKIDIYGKILDK